MIHAEFDERGNLVPYQCVESTLEEFREKSTWNAGRIRIYEEYIRYSTELYRRIGEPVQQWLDGSFVTRKEHPADLDLVTFIPFDVYESNEELLRQLNRQHAPMLDAYFVKTYPTSHPKHFLYSLDATEWTFQFSTTRPNPRTYRKYPKRFLQLTFPSDELSL